MKWGEFNVVTDKARDAINDAVERFAEIVNERTAENWTEAIAKGYGLLAHQFGGDAAAGMMLWCLILESTVEVATDDEVSA